MIAKLSSILIDVLINNMVPTGTVNSKLLYNTLRYISDNTELGTKYLLLMNDVFDK